MPQAPSGRPQPRRRAPSPPGPVLLPRGWARAPSPARGILHCPNATAPRSPERRKPRGRKQVPGARGEEWARSRRRGARKLQEGAVGRGTGGNPVRGRPGEGGEGSSEIKAINGRERPRGVGAPPAALGPPHGPCFPGGPAGLRRGPGRPKPAPQHPPALPRGAYLGHGCLPLGPALGHRLIPQGEGHGSRGGIAASRRPPPRAPGLRELAGSAAPATGLGV